MKKFMKSAIGIIILGVMFSGFTGCMQENDVTAIKLAHALDINHPVHKGMEFMANTLKKKSAGRMMVDIYPGGQLGNERELIELLQIGSLAMTKVSTAVLETFVPEMKIFGVPYVFRDEDHLWNVLNSRLGKELLFSGEKFFLKGMCYYDAGSRSFYTKEKEINAPEDLAGLKIRVMKSITAVNMVKSLGGSATPIPWGELYTSLQQGIVDGAENNLPSFYSSKHFEVCKYYSFDEHTAVPDILIMSTRVWQGLTEQQQQWLQSAIDESVPYQRRVWQEASDFALQEIQKAGVQVFYPDKKPFKQAVQQMHESYKGTQIYDLIEKINSIE